MEILPGALSWLTLASAVFFSWYAPFWVAIFILFFDFYWLVRALYSSLYFYSGYRKMEESKNTDWMEKLKSCPDWDKIYHLCLFTLYEESYEVVKDAFSALEKSDYPKEKIIVVLSAEESRRSKTQDTITRIESEFKDKFFKLLVTWHPFGLPGEIPGKGSNDRWAAMEAKGKIIDPSGISLENVIVSFFDVDTCIFPKYLSCLAWHFLNSSDPHRRSYQPIPLFINNIWQAPIFSRNFALSSIFWALFCQSRPEKLITFSSHSMSFKSLVEVGFKQANIVSDDSRIFWQSFLKFDGNYSVQPLFYPVAMDANISSNFFRTTKNVYKQQRRWAYGCAEVPYVFFNFLRNKKISLKKKISQAIFLLEGHWSWATNAFLIFFLGWLPLALGGTRFSQTLIAHNLPQTASRIMTIATLGLIVSIYLTFAILPVRPKGIRKSKYVFIIFGWFLAPFSMIFFSSLPALEAQTRLMLGKYMGFWVTEKHRKS
ncbi:MAG: glycosyltransferase family 2 protein [bacterium]|nr:glycosyltransferase family 2 protein [bacterium]